MTAHNLCREGHVPPEIPRSTHPIEIIPDILGRTEKARPFGIQRERVGIRVAWNITGASRIPIQQPRPSNICVAFVNLQLDILHVPLNLVRHENAGDAGADSDDFKGRLAGSNSFILGTV